MIVQETISKDREGIARRMNELGLTLRKAEIIDWNPMWVILLYDDQDIFKSEADKRKTAG